MKQIRVATESEQRKREWALVLAGGDGTRLKSMTREITGDDRPKQFCKLIGDATLLEQTQRRVQIEFAPHRTLHVLNRAHESYYAPMVTACPLTNVVIQPCNRGTAPAVLYGLLRIAAIDPDAVVALFPSDHYVSDDREFMAHVRLALDNAQQNSNKVILLGIEPESPEVEYGWIEPAKRLAGCRNLFGVRRFWEKPDLLRAQVLHLRGCLWNSFVIVARMRALLDMIESALPELPRVMTCLVPSFGSEEESRLASLLYESMKSTNFSQNVLERVPERLAVAKVAGLHWNDLGAPARVLASLQRAGQLAPCDRAVA